MIHDYLSADVPSLLACTKHVFSQLLRYFSSGASLKPHSTSLVCCFVLKRLQAVTEKWVKNACAKSARVIYSNELKRIINKLQNQFGESGGAIVSTWKCVCFVCPYCPPSIICTLLSLCPPPLHRIHLTSFTQTETYYQRLFCNKDKNVLHFDIRVVLGNLSP